MFAINFTLCDIRSWVRMDIAQQLQILFAATAPKSRIANRMK